MKRAGIEPGLLTGAWSNCRAELSPAVAEKSIQMNAGKAERSKGKCGLRRSREETGVCREMEMKWRGAMCP